MTEAELLRGCADGDEASLRELFTQTRAAVVDVCAAFLGGHASLPDAVVGTYARAYASSRATQPGPPLGEWLAALAVRASFEALQGLRRDFDEQTRTLEDLSGAIPTLVEISEDPRERVNFMIRGDIEEIPERHREVLAMSELEGLHPLAIAKRRGCSWAVAVDELMQARRALADKVKESFGL